MPLTPSGPALSNAKVVAICVATLAVIIFGAATVYYLVSKRRWRRGRNESVRIALLSNRDGAPQNADGTSDSPSDALANFIIVRRVVTNGNVQVFVAKRRRVVPSTRAAPNTSHRAQHLQPPPAVAMPSYEYLILKRITCASEGDKHRAMQEFALLQQVALKTKNVTTPVDMFYQASNVAATIRAVAPADDETANTLNTRAADVTPVVSQRQSPAVVTLVLEYFPLGDLETYITDFKVAGNPIPERSIVVLIHHVAATLAVMHNRCRPAVVHLDIKPANILLKGLPWDRHAEPASAGDDEAVGIFHEAEGGGVEGRVSVHIGDFGSARRVTSHSMYAGEAMTPAFGSPECYRGSSRISPAIDIWALGITLFNLASGDLPNAILGYVATSDEQAATELVTDMGNKLLALGRSPALVSLLKAMLSFAPEARVVAPDVRELTRAILESGDYAESPRDTDPPTDSLRRASSVDVIAFARIPEHAQVIRTPTGSSLSARSEEMRSR